MTASRLVRESKRQALWAVLIGLVTVQGATAQSPTRLSVSSAGHQAVGGGSGGSTVSDDGRYVAFDSRATGLTANDTNNASDVFVHDRLTGVTSAVSVGLTGETGIGHSLGPAMSADGRFVAFFSEATNLTGDAPFRQAVYVRDRLMGGTTRVANGSLESGEAYNPDRTNVNADVPLAISADGQVVAVGAVLHHWTTGATQGPEQCLDRWASCRRPSLSADGRYLAFDGMLVLPGELPAMHQAVRDVFVYDRVTGTPSRVGIRWLPDGSSSLGCLRPSISGDGRFVAMECRDRDLQQIFVVDRSTREFTRITGSPATAPTHHHSLMPHISRNGAFVVFHSFAVHLVPFDTNDSGDVFIHDRTTALTRRISTGAGGEADAVSLEAAVSADGGVVTYTSAATELTPDDTNGVDDIFAVETGHQVDISVTAALSFVTRELMRSQTIVVRNAGLAMATGVLVGLTVGNGDGTTFPGMTLSSCNASAGAVCRVSGPFATAALGALAPGATATIIVQGRVSAPWRTFTNVATVESHGRELNPADNTASASATYGAPVILRPIPVIEVQEGADPSTISLSGIFTDPDLPAGDVLTLDVMSNNNPALVTATVAGETMTLTYSPGRTGQAVLGIRATDTFGIYIVTNAAVNVRPRLPGVPTVPRNFQAAVAGHTVSLQWSPPAAGTVSGYLLEVGSTPTTFTLATLPLGNVLTFSTTAPPGTYYIRLRARNGIGMSAPTPAVRLDVGCAAPPGPPSGLFATMAGGHVQVQWAPSQGNVERYLVEAGSAPGARNIAVLPLPGAAVTFSTVAPPGRYYLRARAANTCGASAPSSEIFIVVGSPATLPSAPPGLTASVNGSTVHLSWGAPTTGTAASGYVLEAGTEPGLANAARLVLGAVGALTVPAVPSGSYHVRVRAINAAGIGPPGPDLVVTVH